jgi:YidC/Oxa1 family membrane protein insertase
MEERRLLIAVALSLLVLTAYQLLFPPQRPPRPGPSAPAPESAPPSPTATPGLGTTEPSPSPTPATSRATKASEPATAPVAAVRDDREKRVEVQSQDVVAAFTNRGARVVSWRLTRFKNERQRPEEMVQTVAGGPLPLDIETGDEGLDRKLAEALFLPSAETLVVAPGHDSTLTFEYADEEVHAVKRLTFRPEGYLVEVGVSVSRRGQPLPTRVFWGPGVGNPTPRQMEVSGYQAPHGVVLTDSKVERVPAEKAGTGRRFPDSRWVGVEAQHFAALWIPPDPGGAGEIRDVELAPGPEGKARHSPQAGLELPPGGETLLYVGPKDYYILSRLGHQLARVVPVGDWIGPIVVPLMSLLRWVHSLVGNYGWSILVLTLLINLVMAPVRHYSIANSLKMAKLAPEMKVIQERYRKVPALDPRRQEMQKEVSALYARHGMSMGTQMTVGCLPILLTMPFLIAFYRVLQVSIDLRGAPFMWISDLSQKDPLFITPILMGVSMFAMQRMMPSAMDPSQQRMMMIMPVVLMGMFLWAPAGLNLYWLASNLCSIVQQGVTLRILRAGDAPGSSKPRERQRK